MEIEIQVSKSIIYFKINFSNILEKYPKLKKASLPLNFLKNSLKAIKEVLNKE